MKKCIWIAFSLLLLLGGMRLYFKVTDDFRLANITYDLPHRPDWEIPPLGEESEADVQEILKQPFHYIGKGSQSYAFASADGKHVLKFFKYKHLRPHWLVEILSPFPYFHSYQKKQTIRKARKLEHLFAGYHLAWNRLRSESGLLLIHLNPTKALFPEVTVFDKIGLKRTIDLDSIVFILQKKAETTRVVIDSLLKNGDVALAQKRIRQILALYASEYARGLYDMDHGIMHNTGFVGATPIHLDIGKLTEEPHMKDPAFYRPDIQKVAARIAAWLNVNHPKYRAAMLQDLEKAIQEQFGA